MNQILDVIRLCGTTSRHLKCEVSYHVFFRDYGLGSSRFSFLSVKHLSALVGFVSLFKPL